MASSLITSWQVEGEKVEAVTNFIFLGSKITADGNCSCEIKRCLLLGRKTITNLDSVLKSRDITLPKKVHIVKALVFPIVRYGCESWTIKKTEYNWLQEEKGTAEDEMVAWHHWLGGHGFWTNSGREWRTGKPGVLQFMGLQRVRCDLDTGQQQLCI